MVYKATQDVVKRVMPLLDLFASRTIEKARLLQYLSARAGVAWGALELVGEAREPDGSRQNETARVVRFRDSLTGGEHTIRYPSCLPENLEAHAVAEYQRLALNSPLTVMNPDLFNHFFAEGYCASCRYRGPEYTQFHRECHFAGRPVNFEHE